MSRRCVVFNCKTETRREIRRKVEPEREGQGSDDQEDHRQFIEPQSNQSGWSLCVITAQYLVDAFSRHKLYTYIVDFRHAILNKLPTASDISVRELSDSTRRMALPQAPAAPSMPVVNNVRSPPPPQPPTTPARRIQQAKAIWAYNEDGSVSIDYISPFLSCCGSYSTRNLTIFPSGLVM